jgi:hypothetical protein
MKNKIQIKVISSPKEISNIDSTEKAVHFAFRPKTNDLITLLNTVPSIEVIQIPDSYIKTISQSILMLLEMKNVILTTGYLWGHRTDISEYFYPPVGLIEEIEKYRKTNETDEYIIQRFSLKYPIGEGILKYILNNM